MLNIVEIVGFIKDITLLYRGVSLVHSFHRIIGINAEFSIIALST